VLPRFSPGKALQETLHEALKDGGTTSVPFGGSPPVMQSPEGQEEAGGGLELLTPTEGVDFTSYFQRLQAIVYRNWQAVMPQSVIMGERGKVILQFRIMQNGVVPDAEPIMYMSSHKEALDRAAVGAIRASTPFEPLPHAFTGPYIELRGTFKYNLGHSE
jgi:TonB family protein